MINIDADTIETENLITDSVIVGDIIINNENSIELGIIELLNSYFDQYDELCKLIKSSIWKLSIEKLNKKNWVAKDEMLFGLYDESKIRKPVRTVSVKNDNFELITQDFVDLKTGNISNEEKNEKDVEIHITKAKNRKKDEKSTEICKDFENLEIIDPIKLIHGGFVSTNLKQNKIGFENCISIIIELSNKKKKIDKLLDQFES